MSNSSIVGELYEELTCAQAITLGNQGLVEEGMMYVITDYNRGTLGAVTITTEGVSPNEMSWDVSVNTTFDASAWEGKWDPDSCRIIELTDNLGNRVRSDTGDEVERFPWGNALVTGNDFIDVSLFYTSGTLRDNVGTAASTIRMQGGDVQQCTISNLAELRAYGTSRAYRCKLDTRGRAYLDGTALLESVTISNYSYVDIDALQINYSSFTDYTLFYGDGGIGIINYITSHRGYIDLRNCDSVDLDDVMIDTQGRILANGSKRIKLLRCSAENYGYFQITGANAELVCQYASVKDYSYFRSRNGVFTVDRCTADSYALIDHASTGSNTVRYCKFTSSARITFYNSTTGNSLEYSTFSDLGYARFYGTTSGSRLSQCNISRGRVDIRDSVNVQMWYTQLHGANAYTDIRNALNFNVRDCHFTAYGRAYMLRCSGTVNGVMVNSCGYLRLIDMAASGQLRYSNFNSYFYYYATALAGIKQGLHGSGRQSYTDTNLTGTTTGTGEKNFT